MSPDTGAWATLQDLNERATVHPLDPLEEMLRQTLSDAISRPHPDPQGVTPPTPSQGLSVAPVDCDGLPAYDGA